MRSRRSIPFRVLGAAMVLALGSSAVLASRASSARPAGRDDRTAAAAARDAGGSRAAVRAGGRASWRHGTGARIGHVRPPFRAYVPWGGYGWYGWHGWYGGPWWVVVDERGHRSTDLRRHERAAAIETAVRPKRARVLLDGQDVGRAKDYNGTWDRLTVAPGRHTLEFRKPGYRTLRIDLDTEGNRLYRIERRLVEGDGPDARSIVLPDDENAPVATDPPDGPRDTTAAEIRPPGALERGLLRIEASPPDAAVYLDGEFLASADELSRLHGAIPVATGAHRVEIVHPGYRGRTVDVDVEPDRPARIEVSLEPL